ncbi:hypothetical protein BOSEA31B_13320 [Hyphomicrobiales bacterium]|nr:hypothetical protein BOSEA31B_13320 [Hyphomicrobiales bacterium]CAH1699092.1 hypothetical protein BOSEA1005_12145 [Hyphomicrobiales bacterium]CAI0342881.1 hypothetical protein BO1005MUT1_200026 [Hyphomicrobiales bacterium]
MQSATALPDWHKGDLKDFELLTFGVVWKRRPATRRSEPVRLAEIELRLWRDDGKPRHAPYKGLRNETDEAAALQP